MDSEYGSRRDARGRRRRKGDRGMQKDDPSALSPAARADAAAEAFRAAYPAYQHRWVEFFVEHLTDVSRTFEGDLQQAILLAIIGQARLAALRGGDASTGPRGTNASRLAEVTGIPRETVRRKLRALEERGWIAQDEAGIWRMVVDPDGRDTPARRDLADIDERARRRVARLVVDLSQIAKRDHAAAPK
jgi:predicted transcriptional regulator